MLDLHIHSNFSDGELCPMELLKKMKELNIKCFSLTDHDTISGNLEIIKSDFTDTKFITGIEISSIYQGIKIHLLGYDFDLSNVFLEKLIEKVRNKRKKKIISLIIYLENNFSISLSEIEKTYLNNLSNCGKPHFAKILIDKGYGLTIEEVMQKYFSDFKETETKAEAIEVIETIKKASGLVVLAHPKEIMKEYSLNYQEIENLCKALKSLGLSGIECFHSTHSLKEAKVFMEIANKLDLYISGGSDYHGSFKPEVKLGVFAIEDYKDITITKVLIKGKQ